MGIDLFHNTCARISMLVTRKYSTSFSIGVRMLDKRFHEPIYAIYGFVRFADEVVDSFHDYDKAALLQRFREDTWSALDDGISLNPVLHSFQKAVKQYSIGRDLIETFLESMEMDLEQASHNQASYEKYILGSAEVVGLMCLCVFCEGDQKKYAELTHYAMKLGSAFQKINFLRDLRADYNDLGRTYFPGIDIARLNDRDRRVIEDDIRRDFDLGLKGIRMLPKGARLGVYIAYMYYRTLFKKIQNLPTRSIMSERVRIPGRRKMTLLVSSYLRHQMNTL